MGSAAVVPPPSADVMRVYHLTSAEHAISDIALGRLKVARFSDLNDPFELLALNFRERSLRKVIRGFKNAYNADTGLLSFSKNWTNPVLWSHYGNKHRGICLGFNLKRDRRLQEVEYQDERVRASLGSSENPNKLDADLQKILTRTKFTHWSYEQEVRIMVPLNACSKEGTLYFYPFDSTLQLTEVILGPLCNHGLRSIRRLTRAQHPDAIVYNARLAIKSFGVVPKESTVP